MVYKESEKRRIDGDIYVPVYSSYTKEKAEKTAKSMRKDGWAIRIKTTHPKIDGKRVIFYTLYTLVSRSYRFKKD